MRILMSSFACEVGRGSEAGIGWGWATSMVSRGHQVTVLTRSDARAANDDYLASVGGLPGLSIEYVEARRWASLARRAGHTCETYGHYLAWQQAALARARQLHAAEPFAVVHHTTFGSLMLGSPMWRLGIPLIFGPVGGGQKPHRSTRHHFGRTGWRAEQLRRLFVELTPFNPLVRKTVRNSYAVLTGNEDTERIVNRMRPQRVLAMPDTAIDLGIDIGVAAQSSDEILRIAWAGRLRPLKALPLALDAVLLAKDEVSVNLSIAGAEPDGVSALKWIGERGMDGYVTYLGDVPREEVVSLFRQSDVLLFTSLRDTLGSVVLEAASQGLPLVAFDLNGVRTHVPDDAGIKVPVEAGVRGIADALVEFAQDRSRRVAMSQAALRFAESHTWDAHAAVAEGLYEQATTE